MGTKGLVEVHHSLDGSVETGEQLRRDDDELQRVINILEALLDGLFLFAIHVPDVPLDRVVLSGTHHDRGFFALFEELGDGLVVEDAEFSVESDHLCLQPEWGDG